MKAKILGVSASPQKGGKAETLMREVLSSFRTHLEKGVPAAYLGLGRIDKVSKSSGR